MKITELFEAIEAYHGSTSGHVGFKLGHTGKNSHTFGAYESTRWGIFFSDNPKFSGMYGKVEKYSLNIHNTIDLENDNDFIWNFVQSFDPHNPEERNIWMSARANMRSNSYWQLFEDDVGERFVKCLKEHGYDSAKYVEYADNDDHEELRSETYVIFDPKLIKKSSINENANALEIPKFLYHVVPMSVKNGTPLRSLYARHGDKAYSLFARKWKDSNGVGDYHAHLIMFYDNLEHAINHAKECGGKILVINPDEIDLYFDTLERPGFWATHYDVPPDAIIKTIRLKK